MSVFHRPTFLAGVMLTMFALVHLSGCSRTDAESRAHVDDLRYRLLPGDARILTGTFVNDSDQVIAVAQIEVSLFDSDNRRISSMLILVQDIGPGETKSFREPIVSNLKIHGARVRSIMIP